MKKQIPPTEKQYFIAIVPPTPLFDDALRFKQHLREHYQTKAALNSPPHITLHMPFRWKEAKEDQLMDALETFLQQLDPLKVCVDNFSSFPPRVIFMNVVNNEALATVQKKIERFCRTNLNLLNANYQDRPFHPHLTLAFRDLKKDAYHKAWVEFENKEYKAEFIADKIALLKHNGSVWVVLKEFVLESSFSTQNTQSLTATEG